MRKDTTTAKITEYEVKRNKAISKKRYIVEQYFGLSHLHDRGYVARFTTIVKNTLDCMFGQMACASFLTKITHWIAPFVFWVTYPNIKEVFIFCHYHATCLAQLGPTSKTGGLCLLFKGKVLNE